MRYDFYGLLPIPPFSEISWEHGPFLYHLMGGRRELLYIGTTRHLRTRLNQHYRNNLKNDLGFVAYKAFRFDSLKEARAEEYRQIYEDKPVFNKHGKDVRMLEERWT